MCVTRNGTGSCIRNSHLIASFFLSNDSFSLVSSKLFLSSGSCLDLPFSAPMVSTTGGNYSSLTAVKQLASNPAGAVFSYASATMCFLGQSNANEMVSFFVSSGVQKTCVK